MDPALTAAVGATALAFRAGSSPFRRPSWNQEPFFSRPIIETRTRIIPANTDWFDAVSVGGIIGYTAVIQKWAAAADIALDGSGVEFRWRFNGGPLPLVTLLADTELCRETSVTDWPCFKLDFFKIINLKEKLALQVRNVSASDRRYFVGLFGFWYPDVDAGTYSAADRNRRG